MLVRSSFTCPVCGSHEFGSNMMQGKGYCHGRVGRVPCRFFWARKDDWKVFAFVFLPESVQDFDRLNDLECAKRGRAIAGAKPRPAYLRRVK